MLPLLLLMAASGAYNAYQNNKNTKKMNAYNDKQFASEEKQRKEDTDANRRNSLMKIYARSQGQDMGNPQEVKNFVANEKPPEINSDILGDLLGTATDVAGAVTTYGQMNPVNARKNALANIFKKPMNRPDANASIVDPNNLMSEYANA